MKTLLIAATAALLLVSAISGIAFQGWVQEIAMTDLLAQRVNELQMQNNALNGALDRALPLSPPLMVEIKPKHKCLQRSVSGKCRRWK